MNLSEGRFNSRQCLNCVMLNNQPFLPGWMGDRLNARAYTFNF